MKQLLSLLSLLLIVFALAACNTILPSAAPTATATVPPTVAPSATPIPSSTSAASPTSAPTLTTVPTVAATPTTVVLGGGGSNVMSDAVAKNKTAKSFRLSQSLAANIAVVNGVAQITNPQGPEAFTAEIAGNDRHLQITGLAAIFLGDPSSAQFEFMIVGGKGYVHGPAPDFGAPDKTKWYALASGAEAGLPPLNPFNTLDQLNTLTNGWTGYTKSKSAVKVDNQTCDVYENRNRALMTKFFTTFNGSTSDLFSLTDDGFGTITVCGDGYAHDVTFHQQVAIKASPDKKGAMDLNVHLSDFGQVTITAPKDAIPAVTSGGGATPTVGRGEGNVATATPTISANKTNTPAANTPAGIITAFFNAINSKNVNAALALCDEDVLYTFGSASDIGTDALGAYLNAQVAKGITYKVTITNTVGGAIVNFQVTASDGTSYKTSNAILSDGKISLLTVK